jgi:hypothetical protein
MPSLATRCGCKYRAARARKDGEEHDSPARPRERTWRKRAAEARAARTRTAPPQLSCRSSGSSGRRHPTAMSAPSANAANARIIVRRVLRPAPFETGGHPLAAASSSPVSSPPREIRAYDRVSAPLRSSAAPQGGPPPPRELVPPRGRGAQEDGRDPAFDARGEPRRSGYGGARRRPRRRSIRRPARAPGRERDRDQLTGSSRADSKALRPGVL